MGYRLTSITTRGGDRGETGLAGGRRLAKDDPRIEAIGTIDELNCWIGLLRCHLEPADILNHLLEEVQQQLFELGGELASEGDPRVSEPMVAMLEATLEELNAPLPPLRNFVLPAGTQGSTTAHLARAVCRRAERRLVALGRIEPVNGHSQVYLNRLSDLLFVIARVVARQASDREVQWGVDSEQDG